MRRGDPDTYEVELGGGATLPAPARDVIDALAPLVTPKRLARIEGVAAKRTYGVAAVLESIDDPHNASAILRSADAFGVQRVHVLPGPGGFQAARQVSKGAHRWLDLTPHPSPEACAEALTGAGYRILVASMEGELRPEALGEFERVAVVFGNEHRGPSSALRAHAHGTYGIPMRGFVESLNVSVAAAITLHAATRDRPGLAPEDRNALVARWLMADVRDAERIVAEHVRSRH
ncbi:MAG TPA: RNA methyltransferase [Polyangiaceae bacterium LLY-WYZ-15_(1-7)]|nr:tRNA methyltransferase [Myxococcales bacterium]MAT23647.1 tRNA methyltransferase [Sandaracinus sp.]HJK91359.1 RNA methyltransferase [Polyangiaceae bacterium LLY-WYZ-15_(1-7)]HJL02153.1 RNA methyltransferase [Polyangiaceae bacterium LLY-WYZ-15_(1-7)]HJL13351.1 RNA methyltransferase [Polyangiaceae bacterium LLY-WYZ-15_(1-7)]